MHTYWLFLSNRSCAVLCCAVQFSHASSFYGRIDRSTTRTLNRRNTYKRFPWLCQRIQTTAWSLLVTVCKKRKVTSSKRVQKHTRKTYTILSKYAVRQKSQMPLKKCHQMYIGLIGKRREEGSHEYRFAGASKSWLSVCISTVFWLPSF